MPEAKFYSVGVGNAHRRDSRCSSHSMSLALHMFLLSRLAKSPPQYREHREIFFRTQLFLYRDQSVEVEHSDMDSLAYVHFARMGKQVRKSEIFADSSEQI